MDNLATKAHCAKCEHSDSLPNELRFEVQNFRTRSVIIRRIKNEIIGLIKSAVERQFSVRTTFSKNPFLEMKTILSLLHCLSLR